LLKPKLTYIALSIGQLLIGIYKCGTLGILPTTTSDWLTFEEPKNVSFYYFVMFYKNNHIIVKLIK